MYQALEVQNIEELLPPPPKPQPMDPVTENARILMGELAQAFPEQMHDIHIEIHLAFMKAPLVMTSPSVMGVFYAHIMEHIALKARNDVDTEIKDLIEVAQKKAASEGNPMAIQSAIMQAQQQMQDPAQIEPLVAMRQKQIMDEVLAKMLPQGNDPMADPLVQIRMQELMLKKQGEERKAQTDAEKLSVEAAALRQRAITDTARMDLQEQIASDRTDVNRERIEVQRQAMQRRGV